MKISRLFWIGMIFVLSSIAFIGGLLYLQEISIRKSNYTFNVLFDNIQGLNVGDQVDMLGKKIGKVSHSRIIGQKIAVELSIDNSFSFSIPVDSKIEVKSEGLIGSKFISISPGLNTKEFILPGETVEGLREFDFAEITPGIVPLTQDLSAFARRLKATLGEEEKDNIRLTIHNIESLTAELDTFVYNYRNIISDNDKKNFQDFIKNLSGTVKDLKYGVNKEINKLDGMLDDLKKVTDKSEELSTTITELKKSSKSFAISTEKFNKILNKIDNGEGTMGKLVNDSALYENMNNLVNEMRTLVDDIKENPAKYMKAYRKSKK
ncbi:MAG TPA: MlaD family protein [Candidatus Marinimicrobia bacterium]|jgi:phospholipid/cholesterol/gamma-HCH transport system substrate-binding protein|nr:MlaD family protein [Candidatus Neomarinimicrobiota bacterium]